MKKVFADQKVECAGTQQVITAPHSGDMFPAFLAGSWGSVAGQRAVGCEQMSMPRAISEVTC